MRGQIASLTEVFAFIRAKRRWVLAVGVSIAVASVALAVDAVVRAVSAGDRGGISLAQFESVKPGQSESSVETRLGQPLTQQDVEYPDRPAGDACIYYLDSSYAIQGGSTFRLCFRGGVLAFKDGSGQDFFTPTPVL